jgi:hypothetical protein
VSPNLPILKWLEIGLGLILVALIIGGLFDVSTRVLGLPFVAQLTLVSVAVQRVGKARRSAAADAGGCGAQS